MYNRFRASCSNAEYSLISTALNSDYLERYTFVQPPFPNDCVKCFSFDMDGPTPPGTVHLLGSLLKLRTNFLSEVFIEEGSDVPICSGSILVRLRQEWFCNLMDLDELWDQTVGVVAVLDRLFPDRHHPNHLEGKDVVSELLRYPEEFWYLTGETLDSFNDLTQQVEGFLLGMKCKISGRNQVLLILIWLRKYPTLYEIGHTFQVMILVYTPLAHLTLFCYQQVT